MSADTGIGAINNSNEEELVSFTLKILYKSGYEDAWEFTNADKKALVRLQDNLWEYIGMNHKMRVEDSILDLSEVARASFAYRKTLTDEQLKHNANILAKLGSAN